MVDELLTLCLAGATAALPGNWTAAWSLAQAVVLPLLALLAWLRTRPGPNAQPSLADLGWALLALALLSPLCRLAATLASAHMAQIMAILLACALLASRPGPLAPRALTAATVLHGALLWAWHVPVLYAWTLEQPVVHWLTYLLLIASAWWFWHSVLHDARTGAALGALLATTLHTGLLGALLTFAPAVLYPVHSAGARAWGLDPLEDQQLAGLLMWVVGAVGYLGAAALLALRRWPQDAGPWRHPLPRDT